jgi:hypothetical protein
VSPVAPVLPVPPMLPVLPVLPVEPVSPVLPVLPVAPVLPVFPALPGAPAGPAGPAQAHKASIVNDATMRFERFMMSPFVKDVRTALMIASNLPDLISCAAEIWVGRSGDRDCRSGSASAYTHPNGMCVISAHYRSY